METSNMNISPHKIWTEQKSKKDDAMHGLQVWERVLEGLEFRPDSRNLRLCRTPYYVSRRKMRKANSSCWMTTLQTSTRTRWPRLGNTKKIYVRPYAKKPNRHDTCRDMTAAGEDHPFSISRNEIGAACHSWLGTWLLLLHWWPGDLGLSNKCWGHTEELSPAGYGLSQGGRRPARYCKPWVRSRTWPFRKYVISGEA